MRALTTSLPLSRLPADVYERIRTMIVTGQIAPGTRLIETEVAERIAVSRTPAREALRERVALVTLDRLVQMLA